MQFVDAKQIVAIHDTIVAKIGGSQGIREGGLLIALTEKPQASFGGSDLYPTVYDKVAAQFEALVNYHVFVDGNKRTAIAVLEFFLHLNELGLTATASEKEEFVLWTATANPDLDEVAAWIKAHVSKS